MLKLCNTYDISKMLNFEKAIFNITNNNNKTITVAAYLNAFYPKPLISSLKWVAWP